MYKVLRRGDLDIKNSPIRRLASAASRAYFCMKGFCEGVAMVGGVIGLGAGIDGILSESGRERVCFPAISKVVSPNLPGNPFRGKVLGDDGK